MNATLTRPCWDAAKVQLSRRGTWDQTPIQLARAWADHHGVHAHIHGGGWLYDRNERPYIQGWANLADRLIRAGKIKPGVGIVWSR